MEISAAKRMRPRNIAALLLGALFVVAAVGAIAESRNALSYRQMRSASTSLELAAHTLSMIELIDERPEAIELERDVAVDALSQVSVFDDTGLGTTASDRASELTEELTRNATTDSFTDRGEVDELLRILHQDALVSDERAMDAEQRAFLFILLSAASGIAVVWLVLSSQARERRLKGYLRTQAYTDFLTGLPNRRELSVSLEQAGHQMSEFGGVSAMLYMDLDGFKQINDSGGHKSGDEALRGAAELLSNACDPEETLLRLGGDEFGVVRSGLSSEQDALAIAERYREAMTERLGVEGPVDVLGISIGVAVTDSVHDLNELQGRANLAMYEAKTRQGSAVVMYEEELHESARRVSAVERALRSASMDDEFYLEYQPVVAIDGQDVFFVEALLRWESPTLGRVGPFEFITLAERNGQIIRLGEWLLHAVLAQLAQWQRNPATADLSASCNISAYELEDEGFIDRLNSAIDNAGKVDASKLIIEVTESSASGPKVMERLDEIRAMGFLVAIDDFGSGYSNLAQLVHTPFDILKIDRGLMLSLEKFDAESEQSRQVLSAVSAIARTQGAPVVCEGVEDEHQLQPLLDAGISHIQGWLIAKAMSPDDLESFLSEHQEQYPHLRAA